jgi:cytochrome c biogenesis protein CcmG/thiol:disulfide interchange protein DsbE
MTQVEKGALMAKRRRSHRKTQNRVQILAMILAGGGLLILGVVAILVLPRFNANAGSDSEPSAIPVQVNFAAPQLSLTDLQGKPVSLADYRGQVILINNWATWCPPCKAEMPTLKAYYEAHRNNNFTIIAIEAGEPVAEVTNFVSQYGLTFPVWPDPTNKSLAAFQNQGLPNSYVVDRTGTVRLAWTGAISRAMLEKYVTPLLEN